MTNQSFLPFGRTDVSHEEIEELINIEEAIKQLKKGDVDDSAEKMKYFVRSIPDLLEWVENQGRNYPWRMTTDPWEVYLAEIMLQRTKADAVQKIYLDVIERFPNPEALYNADDEEIKEAVHSLGFVNHRQRTLTEVGDIFTDQFDGGVPDTVAGLKKPWRVGDYSARATQLFARNKQMALVDTNFAKVIGRVFDYEMPRQPHKSKDVYALLDSLTPDDPDIARSFNFAILDLGALICTSNDPDCNLCPLADACDYQSTKVDKI